MEKQIVDINESFQKAHSFACDNVCKIILTSNEDIDYSPIRENVFDYMEISTNAEVAVIILEAFTFLEKISDAGLTEDNYANKKDLFDKYYSVLKKLSLTKAEATIAPKPSRVKYALKYLLHNYFKMNKDTVVQILDVVGRKFDQENTRMPKDKVNWNEYLSMIQDSKEHYFNSSEGRTKYQYFGTSLFDIPSFAVFRDLVYKEQPELIEDALKNLMK